MEELNIKNRTVQSRAIKFRFVKPQGRCRVSCEMQAKRACVVRGWARQEKRAYGSAIRERLTGKSVWRWRKRKEKSLCPAVRCGPGGRPMKKGSVRDGALAWPGCSAGVFSGGSVNGCLARNSVLLPGAARRR